MMSSAGASSSSAPTCETISRSSSVLRPRSPSRGQRGQLVVADVIDVRLPGGRIMADHRQLERPQARAAFPRAVPGSPRRTRAATGSRPRSRGSGREGALDMGRSPAVEPVSLAAQQLLVGAGHPGGERLAVLAVVEVGADHVGDVVGEAGAGDLVGAQLAAEVRRPARVAPPRWTWKPSTWLPSSSSTSWPLRPMSATWMRAQALGQPLTLTVIGVSRSGNRRSSSATRSRARALVSTIASLQNSMPVQAIVLRRQFDGRAAGRSPRARRPGRRPGRRRRRGRRASGAA